jgi:hypothetical protein
MASLTKKKRLKDKRKKRHAAHERKRRAAKGTTPRFPIHPKGEKELLPQPPATEEEK